MQSIPLLSLTIWLPIIGGIAVLAGGDQAPEVSKRTALVFAVATFLVSIYLALGFQRYLDVRAGYQSVADIALACVIPITLYPFLGGRVWCRFFCPLAKWMELVSRFTGGRMAIVPNDECISCGECTRYCQMGIDVRAFAQREEPLSNETTCCVFCGICVTVCPVDVLEAKTLPGGTRKWRKDREVAD